MQNIKQNVHTIQHKIMLALQHCDRTQQHVALLAVSKQQTVTAITEALQAGQCAFAENHVQEAMHKMAYFANTDWHDRLEWHFIGRLQANKSRLIAEHFHWVQTIDTARIAQRLNDQRPVTLAPLQVLIQINISREPQKSGIFLEQLDHLADFVVTLPQLRLRGLMAIGAQHQHQQACLAERQKMQCAFAHLQQRYTGIDTLSMGMSSDLSEAILAGSTMVRIGTALFGDRQK